MEYCVNVSRRGYKFDKLGSFACDEAFSIMISDYSSLDFVQGNITPTNLRSFNIWNSMYIIIRKVNTVLANIDKAKDLTGRDKDELMGYLYFMRAYAYYRLITYYGPIVIVGDVLMETNESEEYYDRPRATFDESVDYVCDELEKSAKLMPDQVSPSYFGRPSAGSALGLSARLRLIQASPLWNGGTAARRTYGTWKRSTDGVNYVSQQYNERKWAVAAAVCKQIIDMNIFSLHTVRECRIPHPYPAMCHRIISRMVQGISTRSVPMPICLPVSRRLHVTRISVGTEIIRIGELFETCLSV